MFILWWLGLKKVCMKAPPEEREWIQVTSRSFILYPPMPPQKKWTNNKDANATHLKVPCSERVSGTSAS